MNERIKILRKELKMSQDAFAKKLGLTKNYISLVESGNRNLSRQSIKVLCSIFNISEEWLRNGNGVMFLLEDNNNSNICIDSTFLKLLSMLDVEQLNYIKGIVLGTLIADNKVTLEDLCNFKQR